MELFVLVANSCFVMEAYAARSITLRARSFHTEWSAGTDPARNVDIFYTGHPPPESDLTGNQTKRKGPKDFACNESKRT